MTDHPLTEEVVAEMWDAHPYLDYYWSSWSSAARADLVSAFRAAFDAGREHERSTNADQDWREAEKLRTDIAESDAKTLYERCERIRRERDVFFRQCEYALDRAEKAEADLAERERAADEDDRPWEPLKKGDPLHVGDEVRQDHGGITRTAVVGRAGRVDGKGDPWTAEGTFIGVLSTGTWHVRRAVADDQ